VALSDEHVSARRLGAHHREYVGALLLDPSILGRTIGNPDTAIQMLPRSAFAFMRPTDSRGNLGHNVFRKDGIRNVNASLARTWKVSGEKSLTFRVESINLLNTPQFAAPGNELASSNFGQITNTLNDAGRSSSRCGSAFEKRISAQGRSDAVRPPANSIPARRRAVFRRRRCLRTTPRSLPL
jgi:hypothetical protein